MQVASSQPALVGRGTRNDHPNFGQIRKIAALDGVACLAQNAPGLLGSVFLVVCLMLGQEEWGL